ncbi:MAG TPA: CoA transferase [Candidatus Binataceae bacterium]|nr:CoA transferase [Candidatus Binataceae bacterium]
MAGPLAGIRLVEVGEMVSAPYAAKLLADLGAEVIKVERPASGDRARTRGPFAGGTAHPEKSGLFIYLNTNKRGVTIDLASPRGLSMVDKLIGSADALIHNLAPAEMDRIGFQFERFHRINQKLVMTTVAPYGLSGPRRDWRAEDLTLWSDGGACYLNGARDRPDLPPLKAYGYQAGYQGGAHAAMATMGALFGAARGAGGQHVEVSIQESVAAIIEMANTFWPYMGLVLTRYGAKPVQPLDSFECRDGWIFACCVEEHQWQSFVEVMGNPPWASEELFNERFKRGVNYDALRPMLAEWIGKQTVQDLYQKAQARRVPFAPISNLADLVNSDHLRARGFFMDLGHPQAGAFKYPGAPSKLSRTPWEIRFPAPALGQHNEEILRGELGMDAREIELLRRDAVI